METSGRQSVVVVPGVTMVAEWRLSGQEVPNNRTRISAQVKLVSDGTASISGAGTRALDFRVGSYRVLTNVNIDVGRGQSVVLYSSDRFQNHNEDGTLPTHYSSFSASVEFGTVNDISVGTKTISMKMSIPRILRPVAISVSNAILGDESVIHVNRYVETLTHTITWSCGGYSGTVCEKSQTDSETFTAPIDFSTINTAGDTVLISFVAITYDGDNETGRRYYSVAYGIPAYVAPSCVFSITDYLNLKYVDYVQNKSFLRIVTTPTIAYGSKIISCRVLVGNAEYSGLDVMTSAVSDFGDVLVSVTVTDARGRSYKAEQTIKVLEYTPPSVVSFVSDRVNADGSDNEQGEYVKTIFSANVTPLNNKNSAVYKLEYKKNANLGYTALDVSEHNGAYTPTDVFRIFEADTGSSYDVRLTITDDFSTTVYEGKAPTGFTIFHVPASGHGFGLGKIAEIDGVFDVAFLARFLGGYMQPELETGTDFNDVTIPNTYSCDDASKAGYLNCPFTSGKFVLEVKTTGGGDIVQYAVSCSMDEVIIFYRGCQGGNWGQWLLSSGEGQIGPVGPTGPQGVPGLPGNDGATFTPSVSSDGTLSWTNNKGLSNPASVNIKGPQGNPGQTGNQGDSGATFTPSVSSDGTLSWTNNKGLSNPASVNIRGPQGIQGERGETGPAGVQGSQGVAGYTPQKGVDYFTASDKSEMVGDVLEALPTWQGGRY